MTQIISFGAGTNSTAMLVGMHERNERPDVILFADTGGERPETYCHMREVSKWCGSVGYPLITVVKEKQTLEEDCLNRKALPGIAYGFKSCSEHYKTRPQKRWAKANGHANAKWLVGIDADEAHRAKYDDVRYPLIEWDWGRDECIAAIQRAGISQPGKSACFFCPSTKAHEIRAMSVLHPDLIDRALKMEANADLSSIKGLGRGFSWAGLLATSDMFDDEYHSIEIACGCFDGG